MITTRYDVAEHLRNEEEMLAYIEAAFRDDGVPTYAAAPPTAQD